MANDAAAELKFSLCCAVKTVTGVDGGFDWKRISDILFLKEYFLM